jgi:hypothetical protein
VPVYTLGHLNDISLIKGKISSMLVLAPASLLLLPLAAAYAIWKSEWPVLKRDLWIVVLVLGTAYTALAIWYLHKSKKSGGSISRVARFEWIT